MRYSSKEDKIIGDEIAEIEKEIHSLATSGASPARINELLSEMAFKTRLLLYPNRPHEENEFSNYSLLKAQ